MLLKSDESEGVLGLGRFRSSQVVEISRAAVRPGTNVVGVEVSGRVAAGELANALVADLQRAALRPRRLALRTAQAEHLATASDQHALDPCRTQQPFRGGRLDRAVALYVAGARGDGRSRGNVQCLGR